jgi:hypothetical protein
MMLGRELTPWQTPLRAINEMQREMNHLCGIRAAWPRGRSRRGFAAHTRCTARGLRLRLPAHLSAAAAPRLPAERVRAGVYGGRRAGLPAEGLKGTAVKVIERKNSLFVCDAC